MILLFPLFLIVYALIGSVCIVWVKRSGYSTRAVWTVVFMFFPGLLVFDVPFGWAAFHYLCSNKAGHVVFESVKTNGFAYIDHRDRSRDINAGVKGVCGMANVFTAGGQGLFMYSETEVTHPDAGCLAEKPGKYRYTLEQRGNSKCALFEKLSDERKSDLLFTQLRGWAPEAAVDPQSWCIGVESVKAFKSRYFYIIDEEPFLLRILGVHYFAHDRVLDMEQKRIIAQRLLPTWDGGWVSRTFFRFESDRDSIRSCKKKRFPQTGEPWLWYLGVLKPIKFNK